MLPDPISRLQLAQQEIDKIFGAGYAAANPTLVAAVMASAASDWAAATVAAGLRDLARAWLAGDDAMPADSIARPAAILRPR
jgi:hypothetical protein